MDAPSPERPMRADARRNYERIVACAREAFYESGTDAPLDCIAKRAGVGPGTLYRHFPNRDTLIEAVYRSSIEELSTRAYELVETRPPLEAIELWLREQVSFVMDKRKLGSTLKAAMDRSSETFALCSAMITDAATAVLRPAQEAGLVRTDIEPRDLLRIGHGIGVACETVPDSADRLLAVTMDGLRTQR